MHAKLCRATIFGLKFRDLQKTTMVLIEVCDFHDFPLFGVLCWGHFCLGSLAGLMGFQLRSGMERQESGQTGGEEPTSPATQDLCSLWGCEACQKAPL